ncbi:LOW QUALITY PROTEIN: hypothetical protein ACHAWX_006756 [Stephanocyclus meneghinianus]
MLVDNLMNALDLWKNSVFFHMYPGSVTRLKVVAWTWVPTSGIKGKLVYTNSDCSWAFWAIVVKQLMSNLLMCKVQSMLTTVETSNNHNHNDPCWKIQEMR